MNQLGDQRRLRMLSNRSGGVPSVMWSCELSERFRLHAVILAKSCSSAHRYADSAGTRNTCAVGKIRCRDRFGALRETSFFRVYDPPGQTFVAVLEEEYED
jgi:hypothetical protein